MVQNVLGFCQKKLGRVNPGAGIYDPPQKVVGLKLCGIVVSCLKIKLEKIEWTGQTSTTEFLNSSGAVW